MKAMVDADQRGIRSDCGGRQEAERRLLALVAMVLLFIVTAAILLTWGREPSLEVTDYCRSPDALERFTPLALGRDVKLTFHYDGRTLYARIDSYSAVVAVVAGERVEVVDRDLWDIFFAYCAAARRTELEGWTVYRLAVTLFLGLTVSVICAALLLRARR